MINIKKLMINIKELIKQKWKNERRLIVKTILWESTGLITLFLWLYFFPIHPAKSSLGYFAIRSITYYVYHKWWKQTGWLKQ